MQYRVVNARINSGTNVSTSCNDFVNIGPVTSEFKKSVCGISAATGPQFDECCSFGTLVFKKEL